MLIASINNNNIVVCNGFISIDFKDTYYFDTYGNMVTGWVQDASGSRYYFEPNNSVDQGKMYTGTKMIDGKIYNFDANGKLVS